MQFGTFITNLANKAGIQPDAIKDLLATQLTIPDDLAQKLDETLFTIESAKQNPQLKGYFHAQALSVPDKAIEETLEEFQFDDTVKNDFKNEKSTPAKIKKLAKTLEAKYKTLIDELNKKSGTKESQERIDKLTKEIEAREKQLSEKDIQWQAKLTEAEKREQEKALNYAKKIHLAAKKYANEKQSQDLNIEFADLVLARELAAKKAKAILKDDTLKLVQLENPDLEYMENHKPVSFGDFADRTLANNNMLFVSKSKQDAGNGSVIKQAEGKEFQVPQELVDVYDSQLQKLNANGQ